MLWITALLIFIIIVVIFYILASFSGAPWVPTNKSIVNKMLTMADVNPGEVLYDLESGDGRIILMAARAFHATSVGIEINPFFVFWTRLKIVLSRLKGQSGCCLGQLFQTGFKQSQHRDPISTTGY